MTTVASYIALESAVDLEVVRLRRWGWVRALVAWFLVGPLLVVAFQGVAKADALDDVLATDRAQRAASARKDRPPSANPIDDIFDRDTSGWTTQAAGPTTASVTTETTTPPPARLSAGEARAVAVAARREWARAEGKALALARTLARGRTVTMFGVRVDAVQCFRDHLDEQGPYAASIAQAATAAGDASVRADAVAFEVSHR